MAAFYVAFFHVSPRMPMASATVFNCFVWDECCFLGSASSTIRLKGNKSKINHTAKIKTKKPPIFQNRRFFVYEMKLFLSFGGNDNLAFCAFADGTSCNPFNVLTSRMDYTTFISVHRFESKALFVFQNLF